MSDAANNQYKPWELDVLEIDDHREAWMNPVMPMYERLDLARLEIKRLKEVISKKKLTQIGDSNHGG